MTFSSHRRPSPNIRGGVARPLQRRAEPSRKAAPSKPSGNDKGRRPVAADPGYGRVAAGGGQAKQNPHDNKPAKGKGNNKASITTDGNVIILVV